MQAKDGGSGGSGVFAYSGGCINTTGIYDGATFVSGTFLILFGGGHTDYGGNEVYAFGPLENDAPTWRRLRDRTEPYPEDVEEDVSGNPVSRHTYGELHYVASSNEMIAQGGYRYTDASGLTVAHVFDFGQVSPNSNMPWETRGTGLSYMKYSAYDPTTGLIWFTPDGGNYVGYFTISNSTQTINGANPTLGVDGQGAIDTVRGIWCAVGKNGGIQFYRTNNGVSNDYYTPSTTGTAPTNRHSILYDPVADCFKIWSNEGKKIFSLTPPATNPYQGGNAWVWSSVTPASGSTPGTARSDGTFGRFNYVHTTSFRGYILVNNDDQTPLFYRAA